MQGYRMYNYTQGIHINAEANSVVQLQQLSHRMHDDHEHV